MTREVLRPGRFEVCIIDLEHVVEAVYHVVGMNFAFEEQQKKMDVTEWVCRENMNGTAFLSTLNEEEMDYSLAGSGHVA